MTTSATAERRAEAPEVLLQFEVTDTIANQKLVVAILGERGHAVQIASHGREALELIQQQDFDLVLMDVQMPIVDGFQTTAAIRALRTVQRMERLGNSHDLTEADAAIQVLTREITRLEAAIRSRTELPLAEPSPFAE